jgi:hypothetical protein
MEAELFNRAKVLVLYRTIPGDAVDDLVGDLWHFQEVLLHDHKNWKPVEISLYGGQDGLFWLNIGESNLRFREIRGNIRRIEL